MHETMFLLELNQGRFCCRLQGCNNVRHFICESEVEACNPARISSRRASYCTCFHANTWNLMFSVPDIFWCYWRRRLQRNQGPEEIRFPVFLSAELPNRCVSTLGLPGRLSGCRLSGISLLSSLKPKTHWEVKRNFYLSLTSWRLFSVSKQAWISHDKNPGFSVKEVSLGVTSEQDSWVDLTQSFLFVHRRLRQHSNQFKT